VQIWKGRVLKAHEIYKMPPLSVNTAELDETAFGKMLGMSERRAISFLARDLGFGGNYAEEILLRADIDKDVTAKHVSVSKIKSFFGVVSEILICDKEPQVIVENDSNKDVSLFSLSKYDSFDKIKFDTLVQAIEEFYLSQMDIEEEKQVTSKLDKKKDQFEYRLKIQFNSLENMKKVIEECNKKAEMIYTNYIVLESMISQVNEACISKGQAFVEKEIRDGRVNKIRSINLKEKVIVVELGMDLNIYLDKPLSYSAEMYYQRAKKSKGKLPGIEKSIVLTSKSLERQEHEISQKPVRDVRKAVEKKEWYDKFRHFRSLKGFLVLGGKDATSNEVLIKKHTDKDDLVFHADVAGSPFVIVKSEAKKVDEKTLAEAAQFAGAYSKAWKMKTGTVDVYWVTPDQVSRQAPSGEYIQKGSFMVRGKKNWLKPELRISFALVGDMVICGPEITVSGMTTKYVTIVPGYRKSKELAKDVRTKLFYISSKKEQEILKTISVDSIQRFIPSGTGDIFK
ncbi:MAG: ribosome rescue protein RqcH, partial [archaeon]|nr:ribosome rescue protein RqcH [archaeon]